MSETIDDLKADEKEATTTAPSAPAHEERRAWIPGLILILLGLIFLLDNSFNWDVLDNWWAIFIFIPAIINLNRAWTIRQREGAWTSAARGALTGGLLIGTIALIFLFNLSWSLFWPILLIVLGAGILLRGA